MEMDIEFLNDFSNIKNGDELQLIQDLEEYDISHTDDSNYKVTSPMKDLSGKILTVDKKINDKEVMFQELPGYVFTPEMISVKVIYEKENNETSSGRFLGMKDEEMIEKCINLAERSDIENYFFLDEYSDKASIRNFLLDAMPPGVIKIERVSMEDEGYEIGDVYKVQDSDYLEDNDLYLSDVFVVKDNEKGKMNIPVNDIDWEHALLRIEKRIENKEKEQKVSFADENEKLEIKDSYKYLYEINLINNQSIKFLSDKEPKEVAKFLNENNGFTTFHGLGISISSGFNIDTVTNFKKKDDGIGKQLIKEAVIEREE